MADAVSQSSGHRQRLREKFLQAGDKAFLDYEILELLLSYAIARRDVKPLAKELLARFHSLTGVLDADVSDLMSCGGIGENTAVLIKLLRSLMVRYLRQGIEREIFIESSDKFCDYARAYLGEYTNEVMIVFYLNTKNMLIDTEVISEGTSDCVVVFPSMVAKRALMRSAKAVVLCHNHPSGIVKPSREDDQVTKEVLGALEPLNILLLDHLIVSKTDYYSYRYADGMRPRHQRLLMT